MGIQAERDTFVETIRETIDRHGLIPDETDVVVGVSGGADSVALLQALLMLGIPCTIAHINHNLRGADSDADEQFVRKLASELTCPVVVKSVDVQALADQCELSLEMAARQARHAFFSTFENAVVALAHHADDQAETFLLRLARGAGPDGLSGMSVFQSIGPLRLIRPMLAIPRTEIMAWLKANGQEWREDAGNSDTAFLRNRVRHHILPLLEHELNPNIRKTILRTMDILRQEQEWMNGVLDGVTMDTHQPVAVQRRLLRQWLFEHGVEAVGFDAVENILALMNEGAGTTVFELNARQRVVVEYGLPRFEEGEASAPENAWELHIERGTGWRRDHGKGAGILPADASFDAEKVGDSPLEVRPWQSGDSIAPRGMQGHRKLQDVFTDQKIPRALRHRIPVVTCRQEIIWVPGFRTAQGWEVANGKTPSLHVHIEQKQED